MKIKEKYKKLYEAYKKIPEIQLSNRSKNMQKSCNTCTNMSCSVPTSEKIGLVETDRPYGENCIGYQKKKI